MSYDEYCSSEAMEYGRRSRGFPDKQAMTVTRYVFSSIQGILLLLGLIINFLICFVMVRRRKVKKSLSNFFLFNLSLTELVLWMILLPLMVIISMAQVKTNIPCKILVFSICTCVAVIFGLLAAIAFDRYTNIVTPLKGIMMEERKFTALAVVWFTAIALSAPFLYSVEMRVLSMDFSTRAVLEGKFNLTTHSAKPPAPVLKWKYLNNHHIPHDVTGSNATEIGSSGNTTGFNSTFVDNTTTCILPLRVCDIPPKLKGQISFSIFFLFAFVLPLILILVAYGKVVQRLWQRSRTSDAKGTAAKAKLRAVRMLILVVLTFLITDGPWVVVVLLYSFKPRDVMPLHRHFIALSIVAMLFYASAVLTPTIHAFHSSTVQREIVAVLCCRFRESSLLASSTSSRVSNKKYRSIHFARNKETSTQDNTSSDQQILRAEAE
ncbi:rhodopsin-like [Actinia tenebrosa]|uniref:Rhodopsin-like n=1 Tax=Actinia tenebrosa TaxID=6105 RepID=A0A6P8ITK8_ACTTE|nr:rhodopsin-like [Actinia tenebrosa]XP_031569523.1 rhodopsin-like [Actinia tenebrosa]